MAPEAQTPEPQPIWRDDIEAAPVFCTRPFGTQCTRCAQVCPHQAIAFDPETSYPVIADERCTNCGLCAGICDGFTSLRSTLEDLVARALRLGAEGEAVSFACNDLVPLGTDPQSNVILVPCLAALPPEFWASLLMQGVTVNLCCDFALCEACAVAGADAQALFAHAVETAQAWSGKQVGFLAEVPLETSLLEEIDATSEGSQRREVLSGLANTAADIATGERRRRKSSSVEEFHEGRERLRARGRTKQHLGLGFVDPKLLPRIKTMWPRRQILADGVAASPERASAVRFWVASGSTCDQPCPCVEICPPLARRRSNGDVVVDASHCIACGACMTQCTCPDIDFVEADGTCLLRS